MFPKTSQFNLYTNTFTWLTILKLETFSFKRVNRRLTSWISTQNITTYLIIDPDCQTERHGWEPPRPTEKKKRKPSHTLLINLTHITNVTFSFCHTSKNSTILSKDVSVFSCFSQQLGAYSPEHCKVKKKNCYNFVSFLCDDSTYCRGYMRSPFDMPGV